MWGSWRCATGRSSTESGGILLAALLLTFLVSVLILGLSRESGLGLKVEEKLAEGEQALALAEAGLQVAARLPVGDGAWRTKYAERDWLEDWEFGPGRLSVQAEDPQDGEIRILGSSGSSSADTIRLVSSVGLGSIRRSLQADYVPLPHLALRNVVFGNSLVGLMNVSVEGRVRTNGGVSDYGGVDLRGHITTLTGQTVSGTLDDGDTNILFTDQNLGLPDVDFTWFRQAGEEIRPPMSFFLTNTLVSKDRNPYGLPSSRGIYWIDARNSDFYLYNVAIEGCLAVLNARNVIVGGMGTQSSYYLHRSPQPDRLPALLVDGDLHMRIQGGTFSVNSDLGTISVTSGITGVIYCTDEFWGPQEYGSGQVKVEGAILADEAHIMGADCLIRHRPGLNESPIVEMVRSELRLVPGTVRMP